MSDPDHPGSYRRRLLLATVGLVPQVITETVYALVTRADDPFMPHEIHLITTTEGRHRVLLSLLDPEDGRWQSFCRDLNRLELLDALRPERIHVITAEHGRELADITDVIHNRCAADLITRTTAELTGDPEAALHVSIAGGRKTMGFLLGYALSLFGRPQDRLSHVLVDPPFEAHPEFWYPPSRPRVLFDRAQRPIHTDQANIRLAEIPIVRLRHGLPADMLEGRTSYSETVAQLSETFAPPRLEIDLERRLVRCHGRTVQLQELLLAWYAWLATRRCDLTLPYGGAVNWREVDPQEFLDVYARIVGRLSATYESVADAISHGITNDYVDEKCSRLNKALRRRLGPLAPIYQIHSVGHRPQTRKGLQLPPEAIHLRGHE